MKLIITSSRSAQHSGFPFRVTFLKNNRIMGSARKGELVGNYLRWEDELIFVITERPSANRTAAAVMTMYRGSRTGEGTWEGVLISAGHGQDPVFLPGTWTAMEVEE